ncbi:MAG: hypothetical protein KBD47_01915 [Candidatus Pacebacteria bacterium]|jgi:uncharacterized coiled-coil protein SlyX|nr:hypothetical protein [Candidatus Paceibacterota bacterium]
MRNTQTLEPVYITKDYFRGYQDENARTMNDLFYKQNQKMDKTTVHFDERFNYLEKRIDFSDQKIDDLKEAMVFSFNHLNAKIEGLDERLCVVEEEVKLVSKKIDALDEKFTPLLGLLTLIQK